MKWFSFNHPHLESVDRLSVVTDDMKQENGGSGGDSAVAGGGGAGGVLLDPRVTDDMKTEPAMVVEPVVTDDMKTEENERYLLSWRIT